MNDSPNDHRNNHKNNSIDITTVCMGYQQYVFMEICGVSMRIRWTFVKHFKSISSFNVPVRIIDGSLCTRGLLTKGGLSLGIALNSCSVCVRYNDKTYHTNSHVDVWEMFVDQIFSWRVIKL